MLFTNISQSGLTFIPPFGFGTNYTVSGTGVKPTTITTADGSLAGCSDVPDLFNQDKVSPIAGPLTFPTGTALEIQCETSLKGWEGGVPPYTLTVANATQTSSSVELIIGNITDESLDFVWPLHGQDTPYQLIIEDTSHQRATRQMLISKLFAGAPAPTDCFLEPLFTVGASPASSSSSGSTQQETQVPTTSAPTASQSGANNGPGTDNSPGQSLNGNAPTPTSGTGSSPSHSALIAGIAAGVVLLVEISIMFGNPVY